MLIFAVERTKQGHRGHTRKQVKKRVMKQIAFYTDNNGGYGYRENYGWSEGDRIFSKNGRSRQTIVKVVDATSENLRMAKSMMDRCRRYAGNGVIRTNFTANGFLTKQTVWQDGTGMENFIKTVAVCF